MEPLYTAKSQFTWEECWQMTKTAILRRRHTAIFVVAMVLLCVLLSAMAGQVYPLLLCIVLLVAYALVVRISTHRAFLANRVMRDQNMSFSFYADRFEVEYSGGHTVIPYDQLFAIWETDTNFYLMLSPNQGYVLSREGCNEALADFLRSKNAKRV
ncbi:MAG: YcxB family protein [Candidatus Spyradocola sp.]|jgi:Ca2+/Na+ antiporter